MTDRDDVIKGRITEVVETDTAFAVKYREENGDFNGAFSLNKSDLRSNFSAAHNGRKVEILLDASNTVRQVDVGSRIPGNLRTVLKR